MATYQRNETYYHWITFRDRSNVLYDPGTVTITITNPCGVEEVTTAAMVNDSAGVYYYPYNIPVDGVYGEWDVKVTAADVGESSVFKDKFYILPWDAIEQVRELSGITSKKSVSDDAIARIIWESYKEILDLVYKVHKNQTFLCNPDTGDWINGTNKIFEVKNPPIADYNGDGDVTNDDITLLWKDVDGECHDGKVVVSNAECGKVTLTQDDDSALPSDLKSARITYWTEWWAFDLKLLRKATCYLAAYECALRFTELGRTTQADLSPSVIKFNAQRKGLLAKHKKVLRLIKRPIVGSAMIPRGK